MAETVILSSTFDSGFDGWSSPESASHNGAGAINFFDAAVENNYIYKEGISVPSGSTSVTLSVTFSASASDWFYFALMPDGSMHPEVTATFSDGKASIAKNSYGSPATGPGVTLLGENVAEIHITDAGAALILNGTQVGFTAEYTLSGDVGATHVVDIGSLAVGSSLTVTSVSLSASDSSVDPVDPEDPEDPGETPPGGVVGPPAYFDSSWEAAQEVAGALPAPGWSASEDFLGGANAPTGARPVTAQVGVSGATWTSFKREYWN